MSIPSKVSTVEFTHKQGQYLAYIYYYSKVNGRPPAQADIQRYFNVTPPTVHQMLVALEGKGLLEKTAYQSRAITVLVPINQLPTDW
jgi:Mn-dependent DtxR family transcriptional regulator